MTALQLPCTIFQTQHRMNDYGARDMRCGDLTAEQLKRQFHLEKISIQVDPYTLKKLRSSSPLQYALDDFYRNEETITAEQCARLLFDEFRRESHAFAFYGPYRHLIIGMINHMQYGNGAPFKRPLLDTATREQILHNTTSNSSLLNIQATLKNNIDWKQAIYHEEKKWMLTKAVKDSRLPKFTHLKHYINGLGISVHDTWSTCITLEDLAVHKNTYYATLHYRIQDHFGLDEADISGPILSRLAIFRIWFVLQHYQRFGFKPYITSMDAKLEISEASK
ncbi:DUF3289 family protein [Frateuria aurantia]|uniref:DUF3289 family protein n=1 Tax=Frateuria aurantia (strain ATCC 33424 / DSM 6220 / KCTC 2777 / LMG 1558 / NBRC 3245 / NCIMB 13370) TaxID=767434 RepID=H8L1T2_FRAAD|nr:DUF3289 family protein [Frateuria aurantia]AFC86343.1 hypothetical protein Fraau_1954 [Frateuria aurantia DSM 6220]